MVENVKMGNKTIFKDIYSVLDLSQKTKQPVSNEQLGSVQQLHQCLRGGWGVKAHSLIPLMLLGGGGGSKVKKMMSFLNMFSPDIVVCK